MLSNQIKKRMLTPIYEGIMMKGRTMKTWRSGKTLLLVTLGFFAVGTAAALNDFSHTSTSSTLKHLGASRVAAATFSSIRPITEPSGFRDPRWCASSSLIMASEAGTFLLDLETSNLRQLATTPPGYGYIVSSDCGSLIWRDTTNPIVVLRRLTTADGDVAAIASASWMTLPVESAPGLIEYAVGDIQKTLAPLATTRRLNASSGLRESKLRPYAYSWHDDIYVKGADGVVRRITSGGSKYFSPVLAPNGRLLSYEELGSGIIIYDLQSGTVVARFSGGNVSWSPDSLLVAFERTKSFDGHQISRSDLYVGDLTGAEFWLTPWAESFAMSPSWSSDGKMLAFEERGQIYIGTLNLEMAK